MVNFCKFLMICFMEIITIRPMYIMGWVEGAQRWGGCWQKLKQRSKMTQIVEFRVAMTTTCTHKGPIFHYIQGLDRCALTVVPISDPHSQIAALCWFDFTSRRFKWSAKGTLHVKADQLKLSSGYSEHIVIYCSYSA